MSHSANATSLMVGAAGLEPATFWSRTRRATRLRYAPNVLLVPQAGLEPARPCGPQGLSLLRLPVPPPGQG